MKTLVDFITKHYHWLIFLLLETVSLVLLFGHNSYQGAAWVSTANTVAGTVYKAQSAVNGYFHLAKANEALTARNIYLEYRVRQLSEQLRTVTGGTASALPQRADSLPPYRTIPAKVVTSSTDKLDNLITIDKGAADGVRKNTGVVSGTGVVGIVYLVGERYSVVIPALSSKSSINCEIERSGYHGYLKWEGGASNMAYVEDIPRHARFAINDRVVTSGYSMVFPPGIPVGKVIHVYNSKDGLSYRLQVHLYTDFANLRDVCVIDDAGMRESAALLRSAADSLGLKKNDN